MGSKTFGSSRRWLNPKSHWDKGAIQWSVSGDSDYVDAELQIWDCGRKVTIAFGFDSCRKDEVKQRAKKIDTMILELTKMREALSDSYEYHIRK